MLSWSTELCINLCKYHVDDDEHLADQSVKLYLYLQLPSQPLMCQTINSGTSEPVKEPCGEEDDGQNNIRWFSHSAKQVCPLVPNTKYVQTNQHPWRMKRRGLGPGFRGEKEVRSYQEEVHHQLAPVGVTDPSSNLLVV